MISSIIQALFIKMQPNMSEEEKKQQRIYDLLNTETKSKSFRNNCIFLWPDLNPLITLYGAF